MQGELLTKWNIGKCKSLAIISLKNDSCSHIELSAQHLNIIFLGSGEAF